MAAVQNTPASALEVVVGLGNRPSDHHPSEVVVPCAVGAHLQMMEEAVEAVSRVEEAFWEVGLGAEVGVAPRGHLMVAAGVVVCWVPAVSP